MHSWRMLLLPYLEERELYDRYRFDEPWDGPNNRKLLKEIPDVYRCPSHGHHGDVAGDYVTNYALVTGPGTAFPGDSTTTRDEITDGEAQTILVTDVNSKSVEWLSPADVSADDFMVMVCGTDDLPSDVNHRGVVIVGFADGHCKAVPDSADRRILRAITTTSADDKIELSDR